jgi:hypothetical protein
VVIYSQLPDNDNTSVTNMAEYLAAEVIGEHSLAAPLTCIEHYPEHEGEIGEYSLVRFSSWEPTEVCLGIVWRHRIGPPAWSPLRPEEAQAVLGVHHMSGSADAHQEVHRPDSRSGACFVWVHRRRTCPRRRESG